MTCLPPALYGILGIMLTYTETERLRAALEEAEAEQNLSAALRAKLAALRSAIPEDPEALEKEYIRLFMNPLGAPCRLWQSASVNPLTLMGEPHIQATEWYRQKGIQPRKKNEPADHAGYLLVFFSRLLETEGYSEEAARFWSEHLQWIPNLLREIARHTRSSFYSELAGFGLMLFNSPAPESEYSP